MDQSLLIILIGLGVVVSMTIGVGVFFFQQYLFPDLSEMQERLIVYKSRHESQMMSQYASEIDIGKLFKNSGFSSESLEKLMSNFQYVHSMKFLLNQAGMKIPVDRFILFAQILPVLILLPIGFFYFQAFFLAAGIPLGAHFFVSWKAKRRMTRFLVQLPSALSLITTALRAGHSFQSAMALVVSEMSDPISTELSPVVVDSNMGIPVKTSLMKLVEHLDMAEIRMFAVSVIIQREAGGNLAEVLDQLGNTIRSRQQLKGQISALTAQSRLTGYLIGALPFIMMLVVSTFWYDYISPLFEELVGKIALGICGIMMIIGVLIIRKIVDIQL